MARALGDLVADAGAVEPKEELALRPNWNVAPTSEVPIVLDRATETGDRREIHVARWGLVPPWAKDTAVGSRAFNARSETVSTKPTFRAAVKARRAAIPADGYYEWLKPPAGAPKGTPKRPFFVRPADGSLIYFAGLYEWWKDPERADDDPARWLLSCTILTGPSPETGTGTGTGDTTLEQLAGLHDRLPLPMDRDTMDTWLNPEKQASADEAETLVEQVRNQAYQTASAWTLTEVGTAVGNVRNNGPELVQGL
ncbi:putative SOS response-associated peptidase YedK [Citricoccus muralis]|uniref:Abasic site processing protein n=2 Tax=Citricoccus muralis TaxID=169134 RepID=A0A3D9LI23_9MICC|nr:putative SOS response-associated peptidase YedK [Citricoccus muralis]